jgi:signal transduction histidine kinase
MGEETSDFSIEIIAKRELKEDQKNEESSWNQVNGVIENFIFETLNIKTTFVSTKIDGKKITTKLVDRGTHLFTIQEPNKEFPLLTDVRIQLFYLNRAAKTNFTRRMGVRPIEFGSIFLLKNGFRVYPYGIEGDDSWQIDRFKQQAFGRKLGTRDVIGRVQIFGEGPEFSKQFKETSSRSDGLVETKGREQLIESYKATAHRILQKYVVDVQWAYTDDPNLKDDKDREDISALNNLKGKARVSKVIRQLANSRDVEIQYFNKDFLDILDEKIENASPEVFQDLKRIAKRADEKDYYKKIEDAEKLYEKLRKEIEEAEARAHMAEEARRQEEERRILEEQRRKKAQELAEKKELERLRAERARQAEEIKRKNAELARFKEAKRREEAEEKERIARKEKDKAEKELEREISENLFHRSLHTKEIKEVASLQHHIDRATDKINNRLKSLREGIKNQIPTTSLLDYVKKISLENQKIKSIAQFFTQANFNLEAKQIRRDLKLFIKEYIENVHQEYEHLKINKKIIQTSIQESGPPFVVRFRPLEIIIIIDNLYDNSFKAGAKEINIGLSSTEKKLIFSFSDNGKGIPENHLSRIFDFGFSTTNRGSGIGLFHVNQVVENINIGEGLSATIEVESTLNKGTTFHFIFEK